MSILLKNAVEVLNNLIKQPHAEKWIQFQSVASALESIKLYGPEYLEECRRASKLEAKEAAETYTCESDGIEYDYQIDPEDGSINLGQPDEQALATIKADCLADYDHRMAEKVENHAENLGLDIELRRLG